MSADKRKLDKAFKLTINNMSREWMTEIDIFYYTIKAFVNDEEKERHLDKAFENLRNRVFDIGGDEYRRIRRYLVGWDVKQTRKDLDWTEYGDRL